MKQIDEDMEITWLTSIGLLDKGYAKHLAEEAGK